jgi:ubiquitin carboxyl-terminal hydrolase 4/11/15
MQDSNGRPDEEVSKEHWDGFIARNRSIIVDLMYGQLKSTVRCLTCHNISITFDPFLTLPLPIARPFKINLDYIPYNTINEDGNRSPCLSLRLALNKESKVSDLKKKVAEIVGLPPGESRLIVGNYSSAKGCIIKTYQ